MTARRRATPSTPVLLFLPAIVGPDPSTPGARPGRKENDVIG